MSTVGFDPVIPLLEFRVLFWFDKGIGNLNQKWFQITSGAGNACGFHFTVALVVAGGNIRPRKQDALMTETRTCPDQSRKEWQWQSSGSCLTREVCKGSPKWQRKVPRSEVSPVRFFFGGLQARRCVRGIDGAWQPAQEKPPRQQLPVFQK